MNQPVDRYRALFFASVALAALALAVAWTMVPEGRIPIHFDGSGNPDGWGTRTGLFVVLGITTAGLAVFLGWLAAALPSMGWTFLNVPRKDYWSLPENEARAKARGQEDMYLVGAWTMWLLASLPLLVAQSVNEAIETGHSGIGFLVIVLGSSVLLVIGVVWRQRWYHQNVEE